MQKGIGVKPTDRAAAASTESSDSCAGIVRGRPKGLLAARRRDPSAEYLGAEEALSAALRGGDARALEGNERGLTAQMQASQPESGREIRVTGLKVGSQLASEQAAIAEASAATSITTWTTPAGQLLRQLASVDGEPVFVAKDVCEALGLSNVTEALRGLDDDETSKIRNSDLTSRGGNPYLTVVTEPGLYKLMARSSKPEAKAFDRWVRHEVLPAIRKTGGYQAPATSTRVAEFEEAFVDFEEELTRRLDARYESRETERKAEAVQVMRKFEEGMHKLEQGIQAISRVAELMVSAQTAQVPAPTALALAPAPQRPVPVVCRPGPTLSFFTPRHSNARRRARTARSWRRRLTSSSTSARTMGLIGCPRDRRRERRAPLRWRPGKDAARQSNVGKTAQR